MQLYIDGVDRTLLMKLLARYIGEQQLTDGAPILNCYGKNAAIALFSRLQPEGIPIGASDADWVLSKKDGRLYEIVVSSPDNSLESDSFFMAVMVQEQVLKEGYGAEDIEDLPVVSFDIRNTAWPSKVSVGEAIQWGNQ